MFVFTVRAIDSESPLCYIASFSHILLPRLMCASVDYVGDKYSFVTGGSRLVLWTEKEHTCKNRLVMALVLNFRGNCE